MIIHIITISLYSMIIHIITISLYSMIIHIITISLYSMIIHIITIKISHEFNGRSVFNRLEDWKSHNVPF